MPKWCHYGAVNVTLKDVPESLHRRLREAAEESGRSLNKLILYTLEREFCSHKSDREVLIERIRTRREVMKAWLEDETLEHAIEEGRA